MRSLLHQVNELHTSVGVLITTHQTLYCGQLKWHVMTTKLPLELQRNHTVPAYVYDSATAKFEMFKRPVHG